MGVAPRAGCVVSAAYESPLKDDAERCAFVERLERAVDQAYIRLRSHEALLLLSRTARSLENEVYRIETQSLLLDALRGARAGLPDGPALDKVEKAIEQLTDEGVI